MKQILVMGLMASTLFTAMPAAAQREEEHGRGQGSWVNGPRPNQSADPGQGQHQRNWTPPAREQRTAPAVTSAPVPASSANPQWGNRRNEGPRPDAPRNDGGQGRQWSGDRGATPLPPPRPMAQPTQPQRNWNRTDNDRRDGNWSRTDGRDRGNWAGNDDRRGDNRDWNRNRDNNWRGNDWRNNDRPRDWTDRRGNDRNWANDNRLNERNRWAETRRWNNDWRSNSRYDWQRYRAQNRYIYRQPAYYAPYGWTYGYRRFSIGIYLSNMLFAQNYWIDDPYEYRLPPAYGPLRWVRYYDDALLIDIRDGYVVDVIHDFFW